jgi:protein tyrosine phosphatase
MLTRLTERNQLKATAYWPDGVGERQQFGPFDVSHLRSEAINSHLIQRVFEVRHAGQTRQVVHLHYTEWPDFGTPRSTQTIRVLAELVDAHREAGRRAGLDGPIVTHCSAGVGRAGTFIAIHINLEKMKRKHSGSGQQEVVDIPRTVALLRQSRAGMVQTAEQYQFIYDVVRDAARERGAIGGHTALPQQHNDEL